MAYTQSTKIDTSGTSGALAYTSNNAAGALLILALRYGAAADNLTSVTDTRGNTWVLARKQIRTGGEFTYVYYVASAAAGANTVTVNVSSAATLRFAIHEYSDFIGLGGAILDQVNSAEGDSTTPNSGDVTTTVATELLFSMAATGSDRTYTAGTNYTEREEVVLRMSTEDRAVSSTGTYAGTWTIDTSNFWACIIATFKAAGGAPAPTGHLRRRFSSVLSWPMLLLGPLWWILQRRMRLMK